MACANSVVLWIGQMRGKVPIEARVICNLNLCRCFLQDSIYNAYICSLISFIKSSNRYLLSCGPGVLSG